MEDEFVYERLSLPKIPVTSENRNSQMIKDMMKDRARLGSKVDSIRQINEALNALPTMMLSVSLKASLKEGMDEAQEYVTEMSMRCGVSFDREVLVAGAVRTESYAYFESQIIHNVVLDGVAVDLVDGVREFTDWTALGDQVDQFVAG